MKKLFSIALLVVATGFAIKTQAQTKDSIKAPVDTIVAIQMPINSYRMLLFTIDQNIDSKKISKDVVDFIQKSAKIVQPADKPKQENKPK